MTLVRNCGCYLFIDGARKYIPLLKVDAHTTLLATASRTRLTQTFLNSNQDKDLEELCYVFPLYDGVSVVSFVCTIGDRTIHGVIKERRVAQLTYNQAVMDGRFTGLLARSRESGDVFTMKIGNISAGALVKVEIEYLGELRHDAEVDGLRFTIPTHIAPRYGTAESLPTPNVVDMGGMSLTIDVEMPEGCPIKSIQSPSHPVSVEIGRCSTSPIDNEPSLRKASATLTLENMALDRDFILQVAAPSISQPSAVLETHLTLPNQRALMTTLVPSFSLPPEAPEIVFICDRSGSMGDKIPNLKRALNIFLRSLPVGVKFNLCSFGDHHDFLWAKSQLYGDKTLEKAVKHVEKFAADYGGTEIYEPIRDTLERRRADTNLDVFLLTDGQIWNQDKLFALVNEKIAETKGAIRVFSLGIGDSASHSLIEGLARAGNGFAQSVSSDEKMDNKVVRMLKGAISPHITDYSLEIRYAQEAAVDDGDSGYELVEKVDAVVEVVEVDTVSLDSKSKLTPLDDTLAASEKPEGDGQLEDGAATDDKPKELNRYPKVQAPKYLQTPSPMPALFPHNRTTVYVILSDTSPNLRPREVILKGTSRGGDVELTIPITTLSEKSATIHQLAARKELKELEEGRGWLANARNHDSGLLIRKELEGEYPHLLEKEGVYLSLRYGIASEWCSLVAVEEDAAGTAEGEEVLKLTHTMQQLTKSGLVYGERCDALYSSNFDVGSNSASYTRYRRSQRKAKMGLSLNPVPTILSKLVNLGGKISQAVRRPIASTSSVTQQIHGESANGSGQVESSPLQEIASLQSFNGSWEWDAKLETVIGVKQSLAKSVAQKRGLPDGQENALATLCALIFMRKKLAAEKDSWEMMADKAVAWVKSEVGGDDEYERWDKAMEELF
jgi:hypothetical protein